MCITHRTKGGYRRAVAQVGGGAPAPLSPTSPTASSMAISFAPDRPPPPRRPPGRATRPDGVACSLDPCQVAAFAQASRPYSTSWRSSSCPSVPGWSPASVSASSSADCAAPSRRSASRAVAPSEPAGGAPARAVLSPALSIGDVFAAGGDVTGYTDVAAHSSLVPLFAAHREIIDAVAGVPLRGYRRAGDGTLVEMSDDPSIIRPVVGARYTWVQQCVASLLSDGNACGLPPADRRHGGRLARSGDVDGPRGLVDRRHRTDPPVLLPWSIVRADQEIVHIPWIQRPGRWEGISPLRAFRDAWQAGVSAQSVAKDWFGGGAIPLRPPEEYRADARCQPRAPRRSRAVPGGRAWTRRARDRQGLDLRPDRRARRRAERSSSR
ncbi:MAG: phage portal protein [Desulfobacterales bacterium]|nr:phage portal protein [Desulfobacterales bacterium]